MPSFLLGVDDAVSLRVQSSTNMKNKESWKKQCPKGFDRAVDASASSHHRASI
jgi:hypothetical protein